jgi:Arc/MetJ family transcription regulator
MIAPTLAEACGAACYSLCVYIVRNIHIEVVVRTNIDIDTDVLEEAQRLTGLKTKRAVVHEGLQALIRLKRRREALDLAGKVEWAGNIDDDMRRRER